MCGRDWPSVVLAPLAAPLAGAEAANALLDQAYRALAVATAMHRTGLTALSYPPRADSAALLVKLGKLGVCTITVTGEASRTAESVARAIGLEGAICPPGPIPTQRRGHPARTMALWQARWRS